MMGDTQFQRYIPDSHPETLVAPEQIKRHILVTGQLYYQLLQEREKRGINDVAISRVEQLSPLPYDLLTPHLDKYPNAEIIWAQEEVSTISTWFAVRSREGDMGGCKCRVGVIGGAMREHGAPGGKSDSTVVVVADSTAPQQRCLDICSAPSHHRHEEH